MFKSVKICISFNWNIIRAKDGHVRAYSVGRYNHAQWAETPLSAPQSAPQMSSFISQAVKSRAQSSQLKSSQSLPCNRYLQIYFSLMSGVGRGLALLEKFQGKLKLRCGLLWMHGVWKKCACQKSVQTFERFVLEGHKKTYTCYVFWNCTQKFENGES